MLQGLSEEMYLCVSYPREEGNVGMVFISVILLYRLKTTISYFSQMSLLGFKKKILILLMKIPLLKLAKSFLCLMLNGIIAEINCDGIYEDFVTVM